MWGIFSKKTNLKTEGSMDRTAYSPPLRRDLVKKLYHAAKELQVPMTVLNDRLIEDALKRISVSENPTNYQAEAAKVAA